MRLCLKNKNQGKEECNKEGRKEERRERKKPATQALLSPLSPSEPQESRGQCTSSETIYTLHTGLHTSLELSKGSESTYEDGFSYRKEA